MLIKQSVKRNENDDRIKVINVWASHESTYRIAYWRGVSLGALIAFLLASFVVVRMG